MLFRLLALLLCLATPALAKPNIVMILVDDFSMNLLPRDGDGITGDMPNLAAMMEQGVVFSNYFVTESRCCPSRASILTGQLPHNTGVRTNTPPFGGLVAFNANGNAAETVAVAMQAGGYKTAHMGKYLNGYNPETSAIPPGWTRWVSTNKGYKAFNYTLNDNGVISFPVDHFTDTISDLGRNWITLNRQPFYLELTPFAPHSPYVPAVRHEGLFVGATLPRTPAYDHRPDANDPAWLRAIPALATAKKASNDADYILRKQASKSIDGMIGAVRNRLDALGIADNTYVIFTGDNGYHMGEFSMSNGKQTPFDFDINVPMVIVGPGILPGTVNTSFGMNIDIMPTILQWATLPIPATVDGRSLFGPVRNMAVVEHLADVSDPTDPDYDLAAPPTYTALRGIGWLFVKYETGEIGYYDMTTDPHQLHNIAATLTPARLAELNAAVLANSTCAGAVQCGAAQAMP